MENIARKSLYSKFIHNSSQYRNKFFLKKHSEKKKEKNKKNDEREKEHTLQIFSVYQKWIDEQFSTYIDFISFDLNNLNLNVTSQIIPIRAKSNEKLKSKEERALEHLNCEEYVNAYNKYNEILKFETKYNNQINQFIEKQRNNMIKEIELDETNENKLSIDNLLRIVLSKSKDIGNPKSTKTGIDFRLHDLKINISISEIPLNVRIENPFPQKSKEIRSFIQSNYKEIYDFIIERENELITLNRLIQEFKNGLQFIIDNKGDGLNGKCDIDN